MVAESEHSTGDHGVSGSSEVVGQVFEQLPLLILAAEGVEQRVVAATGAYRSFTGRSELVGLRLREAFPESLGQQVIEIFDRVFATGVSEHLRDFRVQIELPDTGGRMEFYADVNVYPRRGPDGAVVGATGDIVDVTARVRERQAEQRRTSEAEQRYARARDVIDTLQRELLPDGLPVLPRVQIAASYLLADAETAAGGDWFDAVALPDGRVALIVGDVVGHGVAASTTMGQLRILLHEALAATADVAAALTMLNTAAARIRGARAATVCVVLLDPVDGTLRYCTAGHPPPLVASPDGTSRFLAASGAGPVGVGGEFTAAVIGTDRLADGDLVLLYSDGILERPGRQLTASTVELAQVAADIAANRALRDDTDTAAGRLTTQTLELLVRVTGHADDITLLAGQWVSPPAALRRQYAATAESLRAVREHLDEWLTSAWIGEQDQTVLRHAAVELATNAIEHAWIDTAAEQHRLTLTVELTDTGQAHLQVADQGRRRAPAPSPERGLGLQLVERLADSLQVTPDQHGTTATVRHRLSRPARLLTTGDLTWTPPPRPVPQETLLVADETSASRIRAAGPIDAGTVEAFVRAVRAANSAGVRSLTVDLTAVTHLASAGVAALHQLTALHRANGTDLRLYAPTGSPADVVLSLVGLDHHTDDPDRGRGPHLQEDNPTAGDT
ncbi:SpoIIE family protein phosphatase [Actinoplanes sp. TFC3]|uniref:SpoIIE family protein phosphatase n=1 Tax=Actinoplanes sp. TFC3 TaxID=1710355 RepID=UPI000835EC43|nr:SpoIIE family protein phosphatase [Actinoplanes sp. TFC3]